MLDKSHRVRDIDDSVYDLSPPALLGSPALHHLTTLTLARTQSLAHIHTRIRTHTHTHTHTHTQIQLNMKSRCQETCKIISPVLLLVAALVPGSIGCAGGHRSEKKYIYSGLRVYFSWLFEACFQHSRDRKCAERYEFSYMLLLC